MNTEGAVAQATAAPAVGTAGGASPAAEPSPRSVSAAAIAAAAAGGAMPSPEPQDTSMAPSPDLLFDAAAADVAAPAGLPAVTGDQIAAADVAAAAAAAQLPPRLSLARGDSLLLRTPVHPDVAVFGWGRNDYGQLGFPPDQGSTSCHHCSNTTMAAAAAANTAASSSSSASSPCGPPGIIAAVTRISVLDNKIITSAAAGLYNTALLTTDGELFMLGSNDSGLLGRKRRVAKCGGSSSGAEGLGDLSCDPVRVEALEPYPLADVAVGPGHAAAVTQQGLLATWGENEFGQLGNGTTSDTPHHNPKLLRGTASSATASPQKGTKRTAPSSGSSTPTPGSSSSSRSVFVRVAAGVGYSVGLTTSGGVFAWGQGTHGVLGIPDLPQASVPTHIPTLWDVGVTQISAGESHCAALSAAGRVYTWGRGKYGQLGHGDFLEQHAPKQVSSLSRVTSVIAGDHHTLALARHSSITSSSSSSSSSSGGSGSKLHVFAFGRGTFGATGLGVTDNICRASCIQSLSTADIVQIAAGRQHSVALSRNGEIYTWGDGQLGQLGQGCSCDQIRDQDRDLTHRSETLDSAAADRHDLRWLLPAVQLSPRKISNLPWPVGHPVLFVVAGGDHNLAVVCMKSGSSSSSQQRQQHAGEAETLDSVAEHPAAAAVLDNGSAVQPMEVDNDQQTAALQQQQQQQLLLPPWQQSGPQPDLRPYGSALVPVQPPLLLQLATAAAAEAAAARRALGAASPDPGGDTAAAAAASSSSRPSAVVIDLAHTVMDVFSSPGLLLQLFAAAAQQQQQVATSGPDLIPHGLDLDRIESIFTLLLRSYAREVVAALGSACVRSLQDLPNSSAWQSSSGSPEVVKLLFILLQNPLNSDVHGLGSTLIGLLTAAILQLDSGGVALLIGWMPQLKPEVFGGRVIRPVQASISRLAKQVAGDLLGCSGSRQRQQQQQRGLGPVRADVLQLARLLDVFHAANVQAGDVIPYAEFSNASLSHTANLHEEYYQWLHTGAYKLQYEAFQKAAATATSATGATGAAHLVDHKQQQQQQQQDDPRKQQQYQHHHHHRPSDGAVVVPGVLPGGGISSLCEVPFLLTTEAKQNILRDEATLQQQHVVHASAMAALMQGLPPGGMNSSNGPMQISVDVMSLALALRVRRGHVMEDALRQIRRCSPQDLKKPLRVTFTSEDGKVAEEGVDQGGVSREFFQLLVSQLFSPDYGMFVYIEESRCCWFNAASLESLDEFELVGIVLGLACYNGIILDAHLPLTAYKKLMGQVPGFDDLCELYPDLSDGLQQLLDFKGDVETTFCRHFEVQYEAFGEQKQVDLLPGGASIPVTADNRAQFVELYSAWLLTGSVADQFAAFASGFHRVCQGPALSLFRYEEVELLVEGLPHLDFQQMQAGARYESGYHDKHPTIQNLWSVLLALPIEEKRQFLQFCTGCDRAPVAGLAALQLLIQRSGPDSAKLPTAHTCFNTLLLPDYSSKEKLQQKLLTAIHNAQGFGLQ